MNILQEVQTLLIESDKVLKLVKALLLLFDSFVIVNVWFLNHMIALFCVGT